MKLENIKTVALIGCIIVIFLLYKCNADIKKDYNELNNLQKALNSELVTWKDKDGLSVARIQVLETEKAETFIKLETKDSTIQELQNIVKENKRLLKEKGSATIVKTETKIDTIFVPTNNTISIDSLTGVLGEEINNKWIEAKYGFNLHYEPTQRAFIADSTYYKLTMKHKYSVVIGLQPNGFLGLSKGTPFADVKNYNPYTETTDVRTWQVSGIEDKKFNVSASVGYMYNGVKWSPAVGVSLGYTIFKF